MRSLAFGSVDGTPGDQLQLRTVCFALFQPSAIRKKPKEAFLYRALGRVHSERGEHADAAAALEKALALAPNDASLIERLAQRYRSAKMYEKAIAALQKAISLGEDSLEARAELGILLALNGKHNKALAQLRQAVEGSPRTASHHRALGTA